MTRSTRTLIGTILILVLVVAYPIAISALLGELMANLPPWGSITALGVLGLLWFVPAAWVVRWMSRPD